MGIALQAYIKQDVVDAVLHRNFDDFIGTMYRST